MSAAPWSMCGFSTGPTISVTHLEPWEYFSGPTMPVSDLEAWGNIRLTMSMPHTEPCGSVLTVDIYHLESCGKSIMDLLDFNSTMGNIGHWTMWLSRHWTYHFCDFCTISLTHLEEWGNVLTMQLPCQMWTLGIFWHLTHHVCGKPSTMWDFKIGLTCLVSVFLTLDQVSLTPWVLWE